MWVLVKRFIHHLRTQMKMAIIHFQFESIHPFYDGNGRTGRIINILYLILENLQTLPILYLSSFIIKRKSVYYNLLQQIRNEASWEEWLLFMVEGVEQTAKQRIGTGNYNINEALFNLLANR